MEKFLFTDGMNGVREVQSKEELQGLIESAEQTDTIRIWLFSSNEWISYAAFLRQFPLFSKKEKNAAVYNNTASEKKYPVTRSASRTGKRWLKKTLYLAGAAASVFLVFNFTKLKWEEASPVVASAARPANVPVMDIDSLIYEIEDTRGQSLDRNTKNNLRLRNTWPERILLQLKADRETSSAGSRFFNVNVTVDNTTGLAVDNALVKITVWKDNKASLTDTVRFANISYDKVSKRELGSRYKGDSISVSFESVKAKSFNFCYSAGTKNNSGNYNDRWFCRE